MPKNPPFLRGRNFCIFCAGTGMSREHLWPDWLEELFPRNSTDEHEEHRLQETTLGEMVTVERRFRQGHPTTKKVRKVCIRCNTGWMSTLEDRAKPMLKKLITGEKIELDHFLKQRLATWAAKTTMTAEFADPRGVSISNADRKFLMDKLEPPAGWRIWITRCSGVRWQSGYSHRSFTLSAHQGSPVAIERPHGPNTQASTFGIGQLLVHTRSTVPNIRLKDGTGVERFALYRIWPNDGPNISWPTLRILSDIECDALAEEVSRALANHPNLYHVR